MHELFAVFGDFTLPFLDFEPVIYVDPKSVLVFLENLLRFKRFSVGNTLVFPIDIVLKTFDLHLPASISQVQPHLNVLKIFFGLQEPLLLLLFHKGVVDVVTAARFMEI